MELRLVHHSPGSVVPWRAWGLSVEGKVAVVTLSDKRWIEDTVGHCYSLTAFSS